MIVLVTGGARSGKSSFAEALVAKLGARILYVATAVPFDEEMADRIKKHQSARPKTWQTKEAYQNFGAVFTPGFDGAILDCVTILVTNLMMDEKIDWETAPMEAVNQAEARLQSEIDGLVTAAKKAAYPVVMVTNELGMGVVPQNRFTRVFRDIAGRVNQKLAKNAAEVYFTVSGIPIKIKGEGGALV